MASRTVETEQARSMLLKYLEGHKLPMVIEINAGKARSKQQNRLAWRWFMDIAEQTDENAEYWRGYCKLHFGVPIRRRESAAFREAYDRDIRPLPYEFKIKLMMEPHSYPVTSDFKVKDMTEYLNEIQRHFAEQGIILTDPDALKWQQADQDLQERTGQ
jgi:hypothetical protein